MTDENSNELFVPVSLDKLPEAPASLNFYAVTQKGWNLQFTLRDTDELALMKRFAQLTTWLEERHVSPKAVGQQPAAVAAPAPTNGGAEQRTQPPPAPMGVPAPAPAPAPGAAPVAKGGTFQAVKMEVTPKPDGKAELKFYAAGHRYPDLTSTQSIDRLLQYLAHTGDAWTVQHLSVANTFDISYAVTFEFSEKLNSAGKPYKNLVDIEAA